MKNFLYTMILFFSCSMVHALEVVKVDGKKVLLKIKDEKLVPNVRLIVRDQDGRAKGLLVVRLVRKTSAGAILLKGRAEVGWVAKVNVTDAGRMSFGESKHDAALMLGFDRNAMNVKVGNSSISLSSESYIAGIRGQRRLGEKWAALGFVTYREVKGDGTDSLERCGGPHCYVQIGYFGLEAILKYSVLKTKRTDLWAGAGVGFLFALNKRSNLLNVEKIDVSQSLVGALGVDVRVSEYYFIPMHVEYVALVNGSAFDVHQIGALVGFGRRF